MPEGEGKTPTFLFVLIILTTAAQISGFFSRNWACEKKTPFAGKTTSFVGGLEVTNVTEVTNMTNCDMQGLFYQCTYQGCYGGVINNVIFSLAFIAFVLDLGIGGYIAYRIMINGGSIGFIWSNPDNKKILPGVYIISQLLAGIGLFITVHDYDIIGWSAIVFSLPGAALICIILTAIALLCLHHVCED